ncbi:MAG: hypothetical protein K2Q29_08885 [Sphingomonadales bacterium]|nr:hypothetical protein [Sphingomonadales bacterium]
MPQNPVLPLALVAALAAAAPAAAEAPATASETAVLARTVAGEPDDRRPLARLRGPLCLVVAATDQDFARTVAKRIVANAQAAGIRTRSAGCTANALVNFTDNPRGQMQAVRDDGRKLFRRMSEKEIDTALAARDPAYVFQAVEQSPVFGFQDGWPAGGDWTTENSFLRAPENLLSTMVVVDSSAISGLSPVQIADYVTLRLLAPTGEVAAADPAAPQTILSLFAMPETAPSEMTRFDRTYLRTLYKMPRTAFAEEVLAETARVAAK